MAELCSISFIAWASPGPTKGAYSVPAPSWFRVEKRGGMERRKRQERKERGRKGKRVRKESEMSRPTFLKSSDSSVDDKIK